jgi:hypothetical protein
VIRYINNDVINNNSNMFLNNLFYGWSASVVITHEVGFWSLNSFTTTSLQFNKTANAGLLNPYLKGDLVIKGELNLDPKSYGIPEIEKFHISERFEMRNGEQICIFTVSPVVVYKRPTTTNDDPYTLHSNPLTFEHTIPISVHSWQWGANTIVFVSGTQTCETAIGQCK